MDQEFREQVLQRLTKVETLQRAAIRLQMTQMQTLNSRVEKHERFYNWGRGVLAVLGVAWTAVLAWIAKHTAGRAW